MRYKPILLLMALGALLLPETAAAGKFLRRTRERPFPTGWCPLTTTDVLEFKATGSTATIRFVADGQRDQRVDNIYVFEKGLLQPVNDDVCDDNGEWGSYFNPSGSQGEFLERFDSEANGWRRVGSAWKPGSAPPADSNGALHLDPNGLGGVIVSGLKKGRTYVVGGWWYTEDEGAVLTLRVDTKGTLGCGPDTSVTGDSELFEEE